VGSGTNPSSVTSSSGPRTRISRGGPFSGSNLRAVSQDAQCWAKAELKRTRKPSPPTASRVSKGGSLVNVRYSTHSSAARHARCVLAAIAASSAAASPPISASGTLTYQSATFNSIRSAGGNTIIDLSATVAYTGTFNGTSTLHGTLILHPNGTANFHDIETFTGTVNGYLGR
jgi:hypothetical protein